METETPVINRRHIAPVESWPLRALCGASVGVSEPYCVSIDQFRDPAAACPECLSRAMGGAT